jgi:hypothetical protein
MGLIRKSLYLGSGGLVAPHSKKQRMQLQQLAALRGASPEEIKRAGGRSDYDAFLGLSPASGRQRSAARAGATKTYRPCAACGIPVRQVAGRYWDERDDEHKCAGSPATQLPRPPTGSDKIASRSPADRLAAVTRLREAGLITDEEYQAKRADIISQL